MNEELIDLSITNIALSTRRIRYKRGLTFKSILLQNVAYIGYRKKSKYLYFYLSILFFATGILSLISSIIKAKIIGWEVPGCLIGGILWYLWKNSNVLTLTIQSKGEGEITINVLKPDVNEVIKDVNIIERQIISATNETKELRSRMMGLIQENASLRK